MGSGVISGPCPCLTTRAFQHDLLTESAADIPQGVLDMPRVPHDKPRDEAQNHIVVLAVLRDRQPAATVLAGASSWLRGPLSAALRPYRDSSNRLLESLDS